MATQNLFNQAQSGLAQGAADINDIFAQISDLGLQRTEMANDAAKDQSTVTLTEQLAVAKQQRQALDFATKLGTNPDDSNEQLSQLIADKNQLFLQARASLKDVQRKRDTSLFLQPGQWLVDNLTLDKSVNSYNDAANEYNLVGRRIDDIVSSTDDAVKMTKGIAVSVTDASAQAAANVAAARLKDAAFQSNIDSLKSNAQGIQVVSQMRQEALGNQVRQQQLGMEQERLALSRQSAALEQKRMSLALEEKAEGKEEQVRTVQAVNLYRKANGMPELSWTDMKLLYKDPEQKKLMDQYLTGGLTIAQTGKRYLATNPAEALTVTMVNNAQLADGPRQLVTVAQREASLVSKDLQDKKVQFKNLDEMNKAVNAKVTERANREQAEISSKNSMYTPVSLSTLMADPQIAKTATAKLILPALREAGMKDFDAERIVPLILDRAKKGEIPLNQAVEEITFFGQKSIAYNNEYYSYASTMGLPPMKAYNARLPTEGMFGNVVSLIGKSLGNVFNVTSNPGETGFGNAGNLPAVIDLSNPAKVQDYANRYMAGQISSTLKQQAASSSKTKN